MPTELFTARFASFVCLYDTSVLLHWSPKHQSFHLLGGKVNPIDCSLAPGSSASFPEILSYTAIREFKEEIGFNIPIDWLLEAERLEYFHQYKSKDEYNGLWYECIHYVILGSDSLEEIFTTASLEKGHALVYLPYFQVEQCHFPLTVVARRALNESSPNHRSDALDKGYFLVLENNAGENFQYEIKKLINQGCIYQELCTLNWSRNDSL